MAKQKLRLLAVMKILMEDTDEQNPLNTQEILRKLEEQGIFAERKAIYDDIQILIDFNLDIIQCDEKKLGYFIAQRTFELSELRLLVDSVQSSQFITARKSDQLIQKISSLASNAQKKKLIATNFYAFSKSNNEQILYNIDQIQEAIAANKEIQFQYFDMSVYKEKKYRKQSLFYTLIPYALVWENQRYYCIAYSLKYQNFSHYRLDKMDHLKWGEQSTDKLPFDLQDYLSKVFGMYSSKQQNITLWFDTSLANAVFDQFGQEVLIQSIDEHGFTVNLNLSVSPTFVGWLFQFKAKVKVIKPCSLIEEMKQSANIVLTQYADK